MDHSNSGSSNKTHSQSTNRPMVDVPIQLLIPLLQKIMLKNQQKTPLTRAKSDQTAGYGKTNSKRKSIPEVFIFPDLKENSVSDVSTPQESNSLSTECHKESDKSDKSSSSSEFGVGRRSENHEDYIGRPEIMPLSLSYEDHQSNCHGVSEIYFKNVVNELVKTKKYLRDLQMQLNLVQHDKLENDRLKHELHRLRFTAQHMQREHKSLTEQNKKLRLKLSAYRPPGVNDSLELGTPGDAEFREQETQTDSELDGSHTSSTVYNLQQAVEEMKKENKELVRQYNELKSNVKILNSCLYEEKMKNRQKDRDLNEKETEKRKILGQLTQRRQEYDELSQEFAALKKTISLNEEDSMYSRSRHSSKSSRGQTPYSSHTSRRSNSGDLILLNIPPVAQTSSRRERQNPAKSGNTFYRNDLSSTDEEERAPSNVPLPFSQHSSLGTGNTAHGSGEPTSHPMRHGTMETQPHPELECPTCLQTFQDDGSFLRHLSKCIP